MRIDWQTYYDAAKKCHDLAAELRRADKPVHDAVKGECAGMAGDAPGCKQWGETYDRTARDTMQSCTNLADALTNFGYVLYATGYNYGINNRSNPPPPRPDVREMTQHQVTIPTSVRDNGIGIERHSGVQELFDLLVAEILEKFGKLPNGDVKKLDKAASTWKTFANHESVTGAATRITSIIGLFDNIDDKTNLPPILNHLETLRNGAGQVAAASQNLAGPVADYHAGTVAVRADIESAITTAEWAIGLTVVAAAAAAFFTFGGSAAAGAGGVGVIVTNTINTIRTVYQGSNLLKAVGLATAAAGTVGIIKSFDNVPDLGNTLTALTGIIAMRVLIDDEGESGNGGGDSAEEDRSRELPNVRDPKAFDPQTLAGKSQEEVAEGIPHKWVESPSKSGDGTVYRDPDNFGRQIRIMPGYTEGNRPDPLTHGPYAEVSQNGKTTKIPLQGNTTLGGN
ncbi:hypothetical protein [Nocardia iowensis]|uniref:Bacterial toxin 24 domain-containing protein n=1 Tax=Nocardia iowensis TaxID=204891 RepID=A0ABX8RLG4_NOCIO|nr:hypothetical protein [Nocardia iowensis]QXN90472.1 hypothetical protein KV110_34580 [Nocardia iowensis]